MKADFVESEMPTETAPKTQLMRRTLGALVVFSGLCTVFALVVTAAQAWHEHNQERWPEVTAHVDTCGLEPTSSGEKIYHIRCRLSYVVGGEQNVTTVLSMNVSSLGVWQHPRNQIGPLEQWIDEHPPGAPILVRYDPASHTEVVTTDKLVGGPHTQSNIKVFEACAVSFVILLAIARITRLHLPDPVDVLP
jgi:Protein of unknown function (DUF3592)